MTDFLLAHPFFTLAAIALADRDAGIFAAAVLAALGLTAWHESWVLAWCAASAADLVIYEAGWRRGRSRGGDSVFFSKTLKLQSVFGFERLFAWKLGQYGAARDVFWLRACPLWAFRAALLFGAARLFLAFLWRGDMDRLAGVQSLPGLLLLTLVAAVAGRTVVERLAFRLTEKIHHENSAR